jgi:hypothetical protein
LKKKSAKPSQEKSSLQMVKILGLHSGYLPQEGPSVLSPRFAPMCSSPLSAADSEQNLPLHNSAGGYKAKVPSSLTIT